jgi:hypothetical protein
MQTMRRKGYAVVLVSPEYLGGVHPSDAEDAAWAAIEAAIDRQRESEEETDDSTNQGA